MPKVSYYQMLKIAKEAATEANIKKAFRDQSKLWHTDKVRNWLTQSEDRDQAGEVYKAIVKAYETLSNPTLKSRYDATFDAMSCTGEEELFSERWKGLDDILTKFQNRKSSTEAYQVFLQSELEKIKKLQDNTSQQFNFLSDQFAEYKEFTNAQAQSLIAAVSLKNQELSNQNASLAKYSRDKKKLEELNGTLTNEIAELKKQLTATKAATGTSTTAILNSTLPALQRDFKTEARGTEKYSALASASSSSAAPSISGIFSSSSSTSSCAAGARTQDSRLQPDGLIGVVKELFTALGNPDELEWYWVSLEFENLDKTKAFLIKFHSIVDQIDCPLQMTFKGLGYNKDSNQLKITLWSSFEYGLTMSSRQNRDSYGMMLMHVIQKFINIDSARHYYYDLSICQEIPESELSEQFNEKFLQFDIEKSLQEKSIQKFDRSTFQYHR